MQFVRLKKWLIGLIVTTACSPAPINKETIVLGELCDGTYSGFAHNMNTAEVEITLVDHRIESVRVIRLDATRFGRPAADSLPARMVREQTPYVDAVSGATEASHTLINATANALNKAPRKRSLHTEK